MSRLFSIEGIDFAGKTTQVELLRKALELIGYEVSTFKFPEEQTETGRLLRDVLASGKRIPPHALFALFAANRLEFKEAIEQARLEQRVVLLDRYSESEYAYGQASGLPFQWLFGIESPMPQADLVIILDLDPVIASNRARFRGQRDTFEVDTNFQRLVRAHYLELARSPPYQHQEWAVLEADNTPEGLTALILDMVLESLGNNKLS